MSVKIYGKLWIATQEDMNNLILKEKVTQLLKPTLDRTIAHRIFASLYARYVILVNNLGDIYDQICQVQKRAVVKTLLEAATTRMFQLLDELKNIEMSEFTYIDQTLIEEKYIPHEIQLLRPYYFPMNRTPEIQDILKGIRKPKELTPEEQEVANAQAEEEQAKKSKGLERFKLVTVLTPEQEEEKRIKKIQTDTVNLIKCHEKARQARVRLYNIKTQPELYYPQLPIEDNSVVYYEFYHKENQAMLIPVKHTVYHSNFYQDLRSMSNENFYVRPSFRELKNKPIGETNTEIIIPEEEELLLDKNETEQITNMYLGAITDITTNDNTVQPAVKRKCIPRIIHKKKIKISVIDEQLNIENNAALVIQKAWFRYKIKKLVKKRNLKKLIVYNMNDELVWNFKVYEENQAHRDFVRNKKAYFDEQFIQVCQDEKARILKLRSPWIIEDISDEIRAWFSEFYFKLGTFDRYPEEFEGGTILVVRGETKSVSEYAEYLQDLEKEKGKSAEQKKKDKEARKEAKKALRAIQRAEKKKAKLLLKQKKLLEAKEGKTYDFKDPDFITEAFINLEETLEEYEKEWYFIDEMANVEQLPYMHWITLDKFAEAHQELRAIADEFMRIEYELLRMSLALDARKRYKPQKPKKQKKKRKGKKGKKAKKDITADRSLESLYDELVEYGIITSYPRRKIDDFIGDLNFAAFELRRDEKDPMHCMGDIRAVLKSFIVGMGPLVFDKPKSLCIAGPVGCGKKFLAHALCSEMDAIMFDLNATNVLKFENMNYFVHIITKMAKILEPVVLFLDGAHKPFYKKIPKEEKELNPRKLGKVLFKKIVKPIKKEDRIMLIGTTNEPWNSKLGKFRKCYEKFILIPRTDYGSCFLMWRTCCLSKRAVDRNFNFSALTKVTTFFPTKEIYLNAVKNLDIRRRMRLSREPLTAQELLEGFLIQDPPIFPIDEVFFNKFIKTYNKANKLAKKKTAYYKKLQNKGKKKK